MRSHTQELMYEIEDRQNKTTFQNEIWNDVVK